MYKSPTLVYAMLLCCLLMACHPNPYKATNKTYRRQAKAFAKELRRHPPNTYAGSWAGTVNFNLRKPNIVVLHHTAQNSCAQTLRTFTQTRTAVSAHYVICRDGTVHHMLNDYLRAWHAGAGSWGNITDVNSSSIGIELDNNGREPFGDAQMASLIVLLDTLKKKYNIPAANFVGHSDVAPGRKVDPSVFFPWQELADRGFGLWYADTANISPAAGLSDLQSLRAIGYSTKDSVAARKAFALHFLHDTTGTWTDVHRKILHAVQQQL